MTIEPWAIRWNDEVLELGEWDVDPATDVLAIVKEFMFEAMSPDDALLVAADGQAMRDMCRLVLAEIEDAPDGANVGRQGFDEDGVLIVESEILMGIIPEEEEVSVEDEIVVALAKENQRLRAENEMLASDLELAQQHIVQLEHGLEQADAIIAGAVE